jgi:uncharacterized protein
VPRTPTDILIDAGPLLAVINRNDTHHAACVAIIEALNCPFYTTLPVITEAMYLVQARIGWHAQQALWRLILRGDLLLEHPSPGDLARMAELMEKFSDRPMDFADASLVALAERLRLSRIFTVDRVDFSIYRLPGERAFTIIGP